MTRTSHAPRATRSPRPATGISARWIAMSVVAFLVLVATYVLAVRTYLGQYLENAALLGAQQAATADVDKALANLGVISLASLVASLAAFGLIGLRRRSWRVAAAGIATLGVSAALTEVLKRFVLRRPDLASIYQDNAHNSFPSGHTAIAMGILVGALIVVAYRWRGLAMLLAMGWATGVGAAAVTARWHRFSDTLGADMVVLLVGALAALWLLRNGSIQRETGKSRPLRVLLVAFFAVTGVAALVLGLILVTSTVTAWDIPTQLAAARTAGVPVDLTAHLDPVFNENLYYAAHSLALGCSIMSALWFWGTLRRLQAGSSAPKRAA